MSAAKFEQRLFKASEPDYIAQRPIIVDDELGSPQTVAIQYEEEALQAGTGDYRGASPPGLLPMATYKPQPAQIHGFADSPYSQYSTETYSSQQTDNAAGHINQMPYGANNATGQYTIPSQGSTAYHDGHSGSVERAGGSVGSSGDASPHDGAMRRTSQSQGQSPEQQQQHQQQQPQQRTSPSHQNLSIRTMAADASPLSSQQTSPVDQAASAYGYPPNDNSVAVAAQAHSQADPNFTGAVNSGLSQDSGSMLGAYRTTGYGHYSRAPPAMRSRRGSGWTPYPSHYEAINGPSVVSRPSLPPTQHSNQGQTPGGPQLIRTSTLNTSHSSSGVGGYNNPYAVFPAKASLEINGDLSTMADNWTPEEWDNKRRIVVFRKTQQGSQLKISFRPVPVNERPPNSILVSCIWWAEKGECFVTSVDTIHLLEQLLAGPPSRFSVEEKNRIRRNLEGLHPITVSKSKAESEEFFKLIMAFGTPKPRNIEKDVKVFPWRILDQALKKIISKYSAPPPTQQQQQQYHAIPAPLPLLTTSTSSMGGSYSSHGLPPTPVSATGPADHTTATGYMNHPSQYHGHGHGDPIPSPRSLSGHSSSAWLSHPGAPNRTVSPSMRVNSPASSSNYRPSTLPAIYDPRATSQSMASPYGMAAHGSSSHYHHAPQQHSHASYGQSLMPVTANQPRTWDGRIWDTTASQRSMDSRSWEGYGSVSDSYANHPSHSVNSSQPPVYGGGAYADNGQRGPRDL